MVLFGDVVGTRVEEEDVDEDAIQGVGALEEADHRIAEELPIRSIVSTMTKVKNLGTLDVQTPSLM